MHDRPDSPDDPSFYSLFQHECAAREMLILYASHKCFIAALIYGLFQGLSSIMKAIMSSQNESLLAKINDQGRTFSSHIARARLKLSNAAVSPTLELRTSVET